MKLYFYIFGALLLFSSGARSEPIRIWTEQETKRKLEARITDKNLSGRRIKVISKSGETHWLELGNLIQKDQEYARNWVKPINHLTVSVVGSRRATAKEKRKGIKGWKKLKIVVVAGAAPIKIQASRLKKNPIEKKLKAGETITFEHWTGRKYWVRAWHGKKLVDEETDRKKTGL